MYTFKKFNAFLEGKSDIESTEEPLPIGKLIPSKKCSKCGSYDLHCKCYTKDYYDAKLQQQSPKVIK